MYSYAQRPTEVWSADGSRQGSVLETYDRTCGAEDCAGSYGLKIQWSTDPTDVQFACVGELTDVSRGVGQPS